VEIDEDRILFQKRLNDLAILSIRPDLNIISDGVIDELKNKGRKLEFII
jgi:hypothetical protein